jgi:hypothetical protein
MCSPHCLLADVITVTALLFPAERLGVLAIVGTPFVLDPFDAVASETVEHADRFALPPAHPRNGRAVPH